MYLLAIICPPLAVLFSGKPIQAVLNLLLTLCFIVPGIIHAFAVVNERKNNQRFNRLTQSINRGDN